jgi:hypothetical protein
MPQPKRVTLLCGLFLGGFATWITYSVAVYFVFKNWQLGGQFGDALGGVNALFSGLALGGVVYAIILQEQQLRKQTDELELLREQMFRSATSAMDLRWDELAKRRELFWDALREAYDRFAVDAARLHVPRQLDDTLDAAGLPPDIYPRDGRPLLHWPDENSGKLNSEQRVIWDFACAVYPSRNNRPGRVLDYSLITNDFREHFHGARGGLAHFWRAYGLRIPSSYIREDYASAHRLLVALTWLEVALIQWTRKRGAGKIGLFFAAQQVVDSNTVGSIPPVRNQVSTVHPARGRD